MKCFILRIFGLGCTCTVESIVQDDEEEGLIIKWKCVADGNQILVRNIFCDRCFRLYKCENDPLSLIPGL